jgi:hypothetical protein
MIIRSKKIIIILFLIGIAIQNKVSAQGYPYIPRTSCPGACHYPCERNYTIYSYYKTYIYIPTYKQITVRISVEPAEFLDVRTPRHPIDPTYR